MKITVIGSGVMGEAIIGGILSKELTTPDSITASDFSEERLAALAGRYGIVTTSDNRKALEGGEVIVLAVKPQTVPEVLEEIKGALEGNQMVLSIVAGARIATLCQGLNHGVVVRAMPNVAAQIGEGISVWTASKAVHRGQREMTRAILGALGEEIYVPDEKYLDMATAVSGSGPAYVFLFIESLVDAAVQIGLPWDVAREMVLQTVLGAAQLVRQSEKHPAQLRNLVTTPGGTAAQGLLRLEEGGMRAMVAQAIIAAHKRAQTLEGKGGK